MGQGMTTDIALSIFLSASFGLTAFYVAIERRHRSTWKIGVVLLLACAEITLAHALQALNRDLPIKDFWYKMSQLGLTISPTAFLILAMQYGEPERKIKLRTLLILSIFPILTNTLIFTNERHGLIWNPASTAFIVSSTIFLSAADAGIWYWVFIAYSYFVMGLGCFLLIRFMIHSRGIYSRQAWGIVSAAILALFGAALDILHVSHFSPFVTTGLGLAIGTILVTFALAPLRRYDLMSIARGTIINSISDAVIVVDKDNRIVNMNPTAESLLGKPVLQTIGKPLEKVSPELEISLSRDVIGGREVRISTNSGLRRLDLRVSSIMDWRGRIISQVFFLSDITERKQMEQDLLLTQFGVDQASIGIMRSGPNAEILYVNQQCCQHLGYSAQELCNMHVYDIDPKFPLNRWREHRNFIGQHGSDTFETIHRRKDGTTFPVEITATYLSFQGSELSFSFIRDVTERKRTEQTLQMFQFSIDQATDAIFWINHDAAFSYVNEQACRSLGYTREELMQLKLWDIDPVYPKEQWYTNWDQYQEQRHGGSENVETFHRRKDGSVFPVDVSSRHLWFGDQELHVAVVRDFTERKRSERLLQTLNAAALAMQRAVVPQEIFNAVSNELTKIGFTCVIFSMDESKQHLILKHLTFQSQALQAVERLTGLSAATVTIPIEPVTAYKECIQEKKTVFLEDLKENTRQVLPGPIRLLADAVIKGLGVSKSILAPLITEGEVIGLFTVQSDDLSESDRPNITAFAHQMAAAWRQSELFEQAKHDLMARTLAEAKVVQLNEELEQRVIDRTTQLEAANKELEAFAYSVSHDLRAPLRAIDGYTRILVEDYEPCLDAEGKRVCGVVQDEARRMGALIDDLLAFSRLSRTEMQTSRINMNSLVRSVFQELTSREDRERIDFHAGALYQIDGDPTLMHQVWVNLIANAIKFSSKCDRSIIRVIGTRTGKEIVYSVKDNGVGFDSQYVNKLFGVFQRLHSEKEFPGTGVGLAIVQRIIHRHGGRVWAESENGQGATFFFAIPRKVTNHGST